MSGEVEQVGRGAHLDLLLLEEGGQGADVHLVELDELLQVGELGPPSVQGEGNTSLLRYLKQQND